MKAHCNNQYKVLRRGLQLVSTKLQPLRLFVFFICAAILVQSVLFTFSIEVQAASGTVYESENNNSWHAADTIYNDYDGYGLINYPSDIDYWKITFPYTGTANFYLGNIPSNCNYNIYLYSSDGETIIKSGSNSGNTYELLTCQVSAGSTYYVRVYSASGCSTTSYYLFRTRVYPSKTLSVPVYQQIGGDACGSACGRMILEYYNITVSETEFMKTADECASGDDDHTFVYAITDALNVYFRNYGKSTRYKYTNVSSLASSAYSDTVLNNILNGAPLQLPLTFSNSSYFPYNSGGHYVVIRGMVYSSGSSSYTAVINDPKTATVRNIPIATVRSYNLAHSGYIIHIV